MHPRHRIPRARRHVAGHSALRGRLHVRLQELRQRPPAGARRMLVRALYWLFGPLLRRLYPGGFDDNTDRPVR